ncbi:MAG: TIGR04283 family arsenosugar biosynthesis glycosyltransferase [Microcystaceae cyanobacterium]
MSVIIPTLNEATTLKATLQGVLQDKNVEVWVIDGGSGDKTIELAHQCGVNALISPNKGKAAQMNYGATLATGEILLFLHADTLLPPNYGDKIREMVQYSSIIAGSFQFRFKDPTFSLKIIEKTVNWRSHWLSLPYGDQGLFLKANTFQGMGGFKNMAIMEDFELIQRLKKQGKIGIIPSPVIISDRRWRKLGVFRTTLVNQMIVLGYYLGVSPEQLVKWYGR